MKKCRKCQQEKDESQFNKSKKHTSGLNSVCRECDNRNSREYYQKNRKKHIRVCGENRRRYYAEVRGRVNHLKSTVGCQVAGCSESEPCCLDFHHLGEKESLISKMIHNVCSWNRVSLELVKCALVCSNCHRKIHAGIIESPTETLEGVLVELYGPTDSNT